MHRIDAADHILNSFDDGDGETLGTVVSAAWLNDIQENLISVLTAAGISPTKGRASDLLDSIRALIAAGAGNDVANIAALRALTGVPADAAVIRVIDSDGSGNADYWFKDPFDESAADDGINIIVDTDGNRWRKQISGSWIPYSTGESLESLKPAEGGADVTGNNTALNVTNVGGTAASTIEAGALTGTALQAALDTNNFVTSIGELVGSSESLAEGISLTGYNVNDWNGSWTPSSRSTLLRIRLDTSARTVTFFHGGFTGHTGSAVATVEFEVSGNSIQAYSNTTAETIISNKGSNVDFAVDSNSYGPNGFVWTEGTSDTASDSFYITLADSLDNSTSFRLRASLTTADGSADRYVALGDTVMVKNPTTPFEVFLSPDDTSSKDALLMVNAPAQAGATNSKIFNQDNAPTNPGDDIHTGDLWFDSNDGLKPYRWDGSIWISVRDAGAQAGQDLTEDTPTTIHPSSVGGIYIGDAEYGDGTTLENLKPAEAGAQVFTGQSITDLIDTTADNISSGSGSVQDVIDGLKLPSNGGFELGIASSQEIPEAWFRVGDQATSRTEYYADSPTDSTFGSQLSYGAETSTQNGGTVGWWRIGKKFQAGSTGDDLTVSARVWASDMAIPGSISRTPGSTCYYATSDAYIRVYFYEADGTLISTHNSDTASQQEFDANGTSTIATDWVDTPMSFTVTVPANTFRADAWLVGVGGGEAVASLGLESGDGTVKFDDFTWSYDGEMREVSEATWASEAGATHGATWGTNVSGQPTDADLLNAEQLWTDISGAGKPEDNATKREVFSQDDAPTNPADDIHTGDLWIDTNDNQHLYRWSGSAWVSQRDGGITQAINDAATALSSTAAGSLTTYIQPTEPTGRADGDLWFDSDDSNKIYRYNFSTSQIITGDDRNFASSIGNWTDTSEGVDGSISRDGVDEELDIVSNGVDYGQATLQKTVTAEKEYEFKFDVSGGGSDCSVRVGTTSGAADLLDETFTTGTAKTERKYFSTGVGETTVYVSIRNPANQTISVDEVTLREQGAWQIATDTRIATAISNAATAQSTADGKIQTYFATSAPMADAVGDLWWDTDDSVMSRWNGSSWVTVSVTGTSQLTDDGNLKTNIFAQDDAPSAGSTGDLWYDTNDGNKQYRWNGSAWVTVQDSAITTALNDAAAAQSTADGKIDSFWQSSAPGSASEGDLWFDTGDGNKQYRYTSSTWVAADDDRIAQAVSDAATAQSTADGKVTTFFTSDNSPPTADGTGDLWFDSGTQVTKRWNGSAWVDYSVTLTSKLTDDAELETHIFRQDDPPTNPTDDIHNGDLWIDTNDGQKLYWWDGDSWETARDSGIQEALTAANSKTEVFFSTSAPVGASEGDLWYDTDDGNKLYKYESSTWVASDDARIATLVSDLTTFEGTLDGKVSFFSQSGTPTAGATGDLWYDTDDGKIRRWSGSTWEIVSTNTRIFRQATAPSNPGDDIHDGDMWYDSDDGNKPYYWLTDTWILIRDSGITDALNAATAAQSTADSKITAFYQNAEPGSGMESGDLWFDTDAGNRPYRYDGTDWVEVSDSRVATAISNASTAQATADGKVETFFTSNNTPPTANASGDLWYDSGTELLKRWSGSAWVTVSNSFTETSKLVDDANLGQTALWASVTGADKPADNATNSKVLVGPTEPSTDIHEGDIWYDSDDGFKMHRYSGSVWVDVTDSGAIAGRDLNAALVSAGLGQNIADLVSTTNIASETLALASTNVNKWSEIYAGGGQRGLFLSIAIDRDSTSPTFKRVTVGLYGRNSHTGTGNVEFELEVFNNTIAAFSSNTFDGSVTEKSGGLDFAENPSGESFWGPNGLVTNQAQSDGVDDVAYITLANPPGPGTIFRIRVREFSTTDSLGSAFLTLGDTPILVDQTPPFSTYFSVLDSTDQDVLIMANAPAQAGATNSKTFAQNSAPANPGADLHDGDFWIDTNDGNKQYRWSGSDNGGTDEWIEVQDTGANTGRQLAQALVDEGLSQSVADIVSTANIAGEGYPAAANNVNDWETEWSGSDRAAVLNIYFDRENNELHVRQKAQGGHTGTHSIDFRVEVFGNLVNGYTKDTKGTNIVNAGSAIDFTTQNQWGQNGFRWFEGTTDVADEHSVFELDDTPGPLTVIGLRITSWSTTDSLAKRILALGDTAVAVDPTGALRMFFGVQDGSDLDVLIMKNAPASAGADVTAPRAAIKINYVSYSSANSGEAYLHGFGSDGNPADVPAKFLVGGSEVTLSNTSDRIVYTSRPDTAGYIVLDSTLSNKFAMNGVSDSSAVFARKTNGSWEYDNNLAWVSFTPATTDVVIGTMVTGNSDVIASGDAWGYPMSLDVISEAGATNSKTFAQDDAPVDNVANNLRQGDMWVDTNDGNTLYRWDGSSWVSVQDSGASAGDDILAALTTAGLGQDIATFVSDSNAAAESVPLGTVNVVRWYDGPYLPTEEGAIFRIRIDKGLSKVELAHIGTGGHTGTANLDVELEIFNNTISSVAQGSAEDSLTNAGGTIDFSTEDQWGTNGVRWKESVIGSDSDATILTLSSPPGAGTIFRLRIREHTAGSGRTRLALGSELILENYRTPSTLYFNATDSTDQDVLVMQNAPAQSGATNSKSFAQDDAPSQGTDSEGNRLLNNGDIWFDTNDNNVVRRWSDPENDGTGSWVLVRDTGAIVGEQLQAELDSIGKGITDLIDESQGTAAVNVVDWNGSLTPVGGGHRFHVRIDKSNKQVKVGWNSIGSTTALKTIRFELEVIGNTVDSFNSGTFDGSYSDAGTVTFPWAQTEYGSNGLAAEESVGSGEDLATLTLTDAIDTTTVFRLKIVSMTAAESGDNNHVVFGDTPFLYEPSPPLEVYFYALDGTDYDVLAMQNAPANAGATKTQLFTQNLAPVNPANDIHSGDLWVDTDDGNKLYSWTGSAWTVIQDSGAAAGNALEAAVLGLGVDPDLASFVSNTTSASENTGFTVDNVNDWNSYATYTSRGSLLRTKLNRSTGRASISLIGTGGHTGVATYKAEVQVYGDTVSGAIANGVSVTSSGSALDFPAVSDQSVNEALWGTNGAVFTASVTDTGSVEFHLDLGTGSITENMKFRLRVREIVDADSLSAPAVSFGDRVSIVQDPDRPFLILFSAVDSSDYDVLLMTNAPAAAGADVTGDNTSNNTDNVADTPSTDVDQGSGNSLSHDFEPVKLALWNTEGGGYTVSASTMDKYSGAQSGKFSTAGVDPSDVTINPYLLFPSRLSTHFSGERVKVSFWEKRVTGEEPNGSAQVLVYTNNNVLVATQSFTPSSSWSKQSFIANFPAWTGGNAYIAIVPDSAAADGDVSSVLIDTLSMETVVAESDLNASLLDGAGALIQETVISRSTVTSSTTIFTGTDPGIWKSTGASVNINCTGNDPVVVDGSLDINIGQINDTTTDFPVQLFRSGDTGWSGGSGWALNASYNGVWYGQGSSSPLYLTISGLNTAYTYSITVDFFGYSTNAGSCSVSLTNWNPSMGSPNKNGDFHNNSLEPTKTMVFLGVPSSSSMFLTFAASTYFGMIEKVRITRSYAGSTGAAITPPQAGPGGPTIKWRMKRNSTVIYESTGFQVSGAGQIFSPIVDTVDETPPAGTNTYSIEMCWQKSTYSGGVILEYDIGMLETGVVIGSGTQWLSNIAPGWTLNGWSGQVAQVLSDTAFIFDSWGSAGEGGSFSYMMTGNYNALQMTRTRHSMKAIEYRNGG